MTAGLSKIRILGHGNFLRFWPIFGPNGTPLPQGGPFGVPIVIWRHNRNVQFWPKAMTAGKSKIRILGHGNFLRFWSIFWPQWDPIGHKMDPRGSPLWFGAITVRSNFGRNRWPRGSRKFEFWGMVIFYSFWPMFWPQWNPIGPKIDPRGSPPWFLELTVKSNFGRNRWPRGSRKFVFWGMVIFYGFDQFFGPIGTPLAPRWTLGCPHRDLTP